jgi:hypothetical protein
MHFNTEHQNSLELGCDGRSFCQLPYTSFIYICILYAEHAIAVPLESSRPHRFEGEGRTLAGKITVISKKIQSTQRYTITRPSCSKQKKVSLCHMWLRSGPECSRYPGFNLASRCFPFAKAFMVPCVHLQIVSCRC